MSAAATEELAETREITRQRRTLEVAVSDRGDDVADQQRVIAGLAATLANVGDEDAETRVSAARTRLRHLHADLEAAQRELVEFSKVNPTEAELQQREKAQLRDADDRAYRAMQEEFAANTIQRLALLSELHSLETAAADMFHTAREKWPFANGPQRPGAAALSEQLLYFVPWTLFPHPGGPGIAKSEGYLIHQRRAEAWIERWNLQVAKGEKPQ